MERHLAGGVTPETELVVRLERDLDDLGDAQSGLALIKSWASQMTLHQRRVQAEVGGGQQPDRGSCLQVAIEFEQVGRRQRR
ncbi:hypothetical protein C6A85_12950, partial [Mycobacterium sp. ITM-2017-0098]